MVFINPLSRGNRRDPAVALRSRTSQLEREKQGVGLFSWKVRHGVSMSDPAGPRTKPEAWSASANSLAT